MAGCSSGDVGGCSLKRERLITDSSFELTLKLNKRKRTFSLFPVVCHPPSHYPPTTHRHSNTPTNQMYIYIPSLSREEPLRTENTTENTVSLPWMQQHPY